MYEVTTDEQSQPQIGAPGRRARGPHGEGKILYLILERERRVDLLVVLWLG